MSGMRRGGFYIGLEFYMSGKRYRCTDVGSRVVVAIELAPGLSEDWFEGPTYAVPEVVIDEDDFPACSLFPEEENDQ